MNNPLLATTSTEGLQPLGSPAQRSFELISGTLAQRLGPEHAALFGEPVSNEAGDQIDWHADVTGVATPMAELSEADKQLLRQRLGTLVSDIRGEAEVLAQSDAAEDQRLSEALTNAIEIPDEVMIYGVKSAHGTYQPVLVHWAWVRNEQAAVRGILTGMIARPGLPVGGGGCARTPPVAGVVVADPAGLAVAGGNSGGDPVCAGSPVRREPVRAGLLPARSGGRSRPL